MIGKIRGVTDVCSDGTTFVFTAPTRFYRYDAEGNVIDSHRRKGGMTAAEAIAYSDRNSVKQTFSTREAQG